MSAPVRPSTKLPLNIPDREMMRFVLARVREGWPVEDILSDLTDAYFRSLTSNVRHDRRDTWRRLIKSAIENPRHWDPEIDEIAVERAYDGDREVWISLSVYERVECLDRLVYAYDHHPYHRQWPHLTMPDGMSAWSEKVGEPRDRVPTISLKRRQRAARKA